MNLPLLLKNYFQTLLFPSNKCSLCNHSLNRLTATRSNSYIDTVNSICSSCKEHIQIPTSPFCLNCHKPLYGLTEIVKTYCDDCENHDSPFLNYNRSALLYNDFIREKIALYKYRGKESLALPLGQILTSAYDFYYKDKEIDFISFIPLHSSRLNDRGFNQSEQLAILLAGYIGKPVYNIFVRIKETKKQSKQSRGERFKQAENAYQLSERYHEFIEGKNILIVDDIYTTGATIAECTKILMSHKTKHAYSLTLARAYSKLNSDKTDSFL